MCRKTGTEATTHLGPKRVLRLAGFLYLLTLTERFQVVSDEDERTDVEFGDRFETVGGPRPGHSILR